MRRWRRQGRHDSNDPDCHNPEGEEARTMQTNSKRDSPPCHNLKPALTGSVEVGRTNKGSPHPNRPFANLLKHFEDDDPSIKEFYNMELSDSMSDATSNRTSETEDVYIRAEKRCK